MVKKLQITTSVVFILDMFYNCIVQHIISSQYSKSIIESSIFYLRNHFFIDFIANIGVFTALFHPDHFTQWQQSTLDVFVNLSKYNEDQNKYLSFHSVSKNNNYINFIIFIEIMTFMKIIRV